MKSQTGKLLQDITHCEIIEEYFRGDGPACAKVIGCQGVRALDGFQVPEPWNGDLSRARLLFLSSNPSISEVEAYPCWGDPMEDIADFFSHRFHGGRKVWVKDGKHSLMSDGTYGKAVPYWSEVQKRAEELFGREVKAGEDYALSEVVHCKSRRMIGVRKAAGTCSQRYLRRVLALAGARVVVVIGEETRRVVAGTLDIRGTNRLLVEAEGKLFLFLAAPGSNKVRKIEKVLNDMEILLVRRQLEM